MCDRTRVLLGLVVVAAVGLAGAGDAFAAGLGRPNVVGASAVGMGGAFAAIADDPTAIYHNPAGIALIAPTTFLLEAGVVIPDRTYQPADCSVTAPSLPACPAGATTRRSEREMMTPLLMPALAFSTRFGGKHGDGATRLAVGFATYLSQGNTIAFSDQLSLGDRPGVRKTSLNLLELVPTAAYQASDVLSIGLGLRIGVGLFDLDAATGYRATVNSSLTDPLPAKLSATGVTAGLNLGVMLRPLSWVNVAFVYKSPMKVPASGSIDLTQPSPEPVLHRSLNVDLPFPQSVTLGAAIKPLPRLRVAAQVDWTNWSSFETLALRYAPDVTEIYLDLADTWTAHLGADYRLGDAMTLRLGYSFETQAVPDVSANRQYVDGPTHTVGAGFGYAITRSIRLDAAVEYLFVLERTVSPSAATVPVGLQNTAPGTYRGAIYQALVTAQYRY